MARWLGLAFVVVTLALFLSAVNAQDTKQKKIDVETMFKKLDTNNDAKLSKDEFLKLADRFKDREKAREKLAQAFDKIDPQNRGISKAELKNYLDSVKKN